MRNPFDRIFKNAGEIDPRGLLHLLGILPLGVTAEVTEVNRELGLSPRFPDLLFKVTQPGRPPYLLHLEFQLRPRGDEPRRMLEYAQLAWLHYRLPVIGILVLPLERYAIEPVPDFFIAEIGAMRIEYRFRVVRLWELDAASFFDLGRTSLLPLIALARVAPEDLARAAAAVAAGGDRTLVETFNRLGELRYDRDELKELLSMELSRILIPIFEGVLADEKATTLRQCVSRLLTRRYPSVAVPPQLDRCFDPDVLENLLDQIFSATTPAEVEEALRQTLVTRSN